MLDREKVIKGLHCCSHTDGANCIYCPYDISDSDCTALMSMDVLALLKEQDELLRKLQKDKDKLCLDVSEWKHKYHDGPLKEHEPKPDKCIICEGCGHKLQDDWNWCPWCKRETARGRQVKSNGF